jgi:phage regulator Rha-like protein
MGVTMQDNLSLLSQQEIENRIFSVRGVQVMLDSHLAEMYSVETKLLNRAVKRNMERFPVSFRFQLTENEWERLRSQIMTLNSGESLRFQNGTINSDEFLRFQNGTSSLKHGGRRYLPYVFTEQGVAMLSAVLRSETAVRVSIRIINAFVEMRKVLMNNGALIYRLDKIELKQLESDQKIEEIFKALESQNPQPEKGVFFDGQVFDAYVFVCGLIKKANSSILLIDTYVDETVLTLLAKRNKQVSAVIYTPAITPQLKLDLKKHNAQYPAVQIKTLASSHDRFLIIDHTELYHFGASLKDLGKKWFAFSKLNGFTDEILKRIT